MHAKVVKSFLGVPDGHIHPKPFTPGDLVSGNLAEVAVAEGWAVGVAADDRASVAADDASSVAAGDTPSASRPPAARRAKVTKAWTMADGGKVARGAILEGEDAEQAIAAGHAIAIADRGPAPEQK